MFRRGVVVGLSIVVGLQAGLFGAWLLFPKATFSISTSYTIMKSIAPEWEWGAAFVSCGGLLLLNGLTLWFRLWRARPVPLWLQVLTTVVLGSKLLLVVCIFYLAAVESTATPIFAVMLAACLVVLLSALDEAGVVGKLTAWRRRVWGT